MIEYANGLSLTGNFQGQEERIDELRDIHRLESKSQSDQIHKLRAQLDEAEALLKASQHSTSQLETESTKQKAEVDRLRSEVEKTKASLKDEEEKRVKDEEWARYTDENKRGAGNTMNRG